ncbi:MAG: hypothetical protein WCA84_17020 [Ignavibacteriaceae bacterium]
MTLESFTAKELAILKSFKKPYDIQQFLNSLKYNSEYITNSPRKVLKFRKANCFEGAIFAAAALRLLGFKPLIVDMMAHNDDDHVIAIFKHGNFYGAVAKSNTKLLRYREPVYKTLRELVMSYFDFYFNVLGELSLRSYSNPVDLSKFDGYNWIITDEDLEFIGDYLYTIKHHLLLSKKQFNLLNKADKDIVDLCFSNSVKNGLYKPVKKKSSK